MTSLTTQRLQSALVDVCDAVISARDELGRLDAQAGDGDLGSTLNTGFNSVRGRLVAETFADSSSLLAMVAGELGRRAPSTMGSLLSSSFRGAAAQVKDLSSIEASNLADMLSAMVDQVQQVGGASEGQRSVVDAMAPAARAASEQAAAGQGVEAVAEAAARAASTGARATAAMDAQVGRAAWVGARAVGIEDAGARAFAIILQAFSDALAPPAESG